MLTILLWVVSFVIIAVAFTKTKHWLSGLMRFSFCIGLGLSFWVTSVYALWLLAFDLQVDAIENGNMANQWGLPSVVIIFTVGAYFTEKFTRKGEDDFEKFLL